VKEEGDGCTKRKLFVQEGRMLCKKRRGCRRRKEIMQEKGGHIKKKEIV
jgi:hypothetical protein